MLERNYIWFAFAVISFVLGLTSAFDPAIPIFLLVWFTLNTILFSVLFAFDIPKIGVVVPTSIGLMTSELEFDEEYTVYFYDKNKQIKKEIMIWDGMRDTGDAYNMFYSLDEKRSLHYDQTIKVTP